jgi:hypothetical protein
MKMNWNLITFLPTFQNLENGGYIIFRLKGTILRCIGQNIAKGDGNVLRQAFIKNNFFASTSKQNLKSK